MSKVARSVKRLCLCALLASSIEAACLTLARAQAPLSGVDLLWLEPPPGTSPSATTGAFGLSGDGAVVVGVTVTAAPRATRWDVNLQSGQAVSVLLPDLGGGSEARAVSHDGRIIAGVSADLHGQHAVIWRNGLLEPLPSPVIDGVGSAWGVSGDGRFVVGELDTASGVEAFIWDVSGPAQPMSLHEAPAWFGSRALGISDDGSTIAGYVFRRVDVGMATERTVIEAALWDRVSGSSRLLGWLGSGELSQANHASSQGGVAVGGSLRRTASSSLEAVSWTLDRGACSSLGGLASLASGSEAVGVSANGEVIVIQAVSSGVNPVKPFYFHRRQGARDLNEILRTDYGLQQFGTLIQVGAPRGSSPGRGLSPDGLSIVGTGNPPAAGAAPSGYLLRLPDSNGNGLADHLDLERVVRVNTQSDLADLQPGDGVCGDPIAGTCSLRAAIQEASALGMETRIVLEAGDYTLSLAGVAEDAGLSGDLDLLDTDITIEGVLDGLGDPATSIESDPAAQDRILDVRGRGKVTLRNVLLRGGGSPNEPGGAIRALRTACGDPDLTLENVRLLRNGGIMGSQGDGGAVWLDGTLEATDVDFEENASGGRGGALRLEPGARATLRRCRFLRNRSGGSGGAVSSGGALDLLACRLLENEAGAGGGGVHNRGELEVVDCTLSDNAARGGGAIFNEEASLESPVMTRIASSTLNANRAEDLGGGAIFNSGETFIINTTISGNSCAPGSGGGVLQIGLSPMRLVNVTLYGNSAANGGGVAYSQIGAFAPITIVNSIIADSTPENFFDSPSHPPLLAEGVNLDTDGTCGFGAGHLSGTPASPLDAMLGPFADNGGLTFTHALLVGSPAIGAGGPFPCRDGSDEIRRDQRGVERLQCDLGAVASAAHDPCPRGDIGGTGDAGPGLTAGHAMAFDELRRDVVLYAPRGETWTWEGGAWTRESPSHSPPAGLAAALAYHGGLQGVVLYAGGPSSSEILLWDGSDWAPVTATNPPPPRTGPAMAYDPASGEIVLFGGRSVPNTSIRLNDTWVLEAGGASWRDVSTTTRPSLLADPRMAFDPGGLGVLVGLGQIGGEAWTWDRSTPSPGSDWRFGPLWPEAGATHGLLGLAHDSDRGVTVLFDETAFTGGDPIVEFHAGTPTTPASWYTIPSAARLSPFLAAAYDQERGQCVVFDGQFPSGPGETFVYPVWTSRKFCVDGMSTGVSWAWSISGPGYSVSNLDACNGCGLMPGDPASDIAEKFVESINAHGCAFVEATGVTGHPECFEVRVAGAGPFELSVGPAGAPPTCTTTLQNPCRFNPDLYEVLSFDFRFLRGDVDGSGDVPGSTADIIRYANVCFLGTGMIPCRAAADVNGDGQVCGSVTDIVYLASFLFLGQEAPPFPFPGCGISADEDDIALGCELEPEACR